MRNTMKQLILTGFLITLALSLSSCTRTTAEKDFDANSALFSAVLDSGQTDAQKVCQATVIKANECIAPGFGYDAYASCHSTKISSITSVQWTKILTAVSSAIQTNACNIAHKRYEGHSAATAAYDAFITGKYTAAVTANDGTATSWTITTSTTTSGVTTTSTATIAVGTYLKGKDAADTF